MPCRGSGGRAQTCTSHSARRRADRLQLGGVKRRGGRVQTCRSKARSSIFLRLAMSAHESLFAIILRRREERR